MQKPNPHLLMELKFIVPLLIKHPAGSASLTTKSQKKNTYIPKNLLRRSISLELAVGRSCQGKVYYSNLNVNSDKKCHSIRKPSQQRNR